jgi:hypothetical protein
MMVPSDRDLRIDFLRGLALIIIFIDHVPGNVLSRFTPRAFGFSNAADVFVLLAGMSAGLAYGTCSAQKGIRAILPRLLRRITQLYSAHLALLWISIGLTVAATLVFNKAEFMERAVPVLVQTDLLAAAWSSLVLNLQPRYLDILPLYVVLLLALPLFLLLQRAQRGAALVLSVAIWVLAKSTGLNLPSSRSPDGWYFNPFAWQLLFCIGLLGAHTFRQRTQRMRSHYLLIAIAIAYVMVALALTTPCRFRIAIGHCVFGVQQSDIADLAPWRIAHGLALVYLALIAIPNCAPWLVRYPARALVTLGQNSLSVFCVGSLVGLLSAIALTIFGSGWRSQVLLNTAGTALLFATAWWNNWRGRFELQHAKAWPRIVLRGVLALPVVGFGRLFHALTLGSNRLRARRRIVT